MSFPHRLRRPVLVGLLLAGSAGTLAACGDDTSADASGDRPVVAATAPQIDGMVRALAGDGVQVASVVAATADVHELELRPSQVRALKTADLVLEPGRGNDAWASEALDQIDARRVDLSSDLGGSERHWWMDPSLAEKAAVRAAAELDRLDPQGKADRAVRLEAFVGELQELDEATKQCFATIPKDARLIVTDHDAAGAYAARYGLTVAGTISPGVEPEAAPSGQRIVELTRDMKAKGVKAVFPIAPHGSELSATIAERGGATLAEPLWADALPGATHEHEHGAEEHAEGEDHADGTTPDGEAASTPEDQAGEDHTGDDHTGDEHAEGEHEPTLAEAARLNGEAVAEALGASPAACKTFLG